MNYKCPKCSSDFITGTKFCQTCCNLELDFKEKLTCPKCKTTYPTITKFCVNDGSKLFRPEDLIHKCVICNISYSNDIKFCPRDGGEIKVILKHQFSQPIYPKNDGRNNYNQKYPKASLGNRFLATLLDGLISIGLSIPAILFFVAGLDRNKFNGYSNDGSPGLLFIAFFFCLIPLGYNLIKDGLGQGQSWGKKVLNIMVVNLDNNTPCDIGKSFLRNFISILIAIVPFIGWLIDPIMVLATYDGRKVGDKAVNTQVIDKNKFN